MDTASVPKSVDAYIAAAPEAVRPVLREMRALIRSAAPADAERISWAMPTYTGKNNLVHFAAHKAHTGFYPGAEAMERFQAALAPYKTSKERGAIPLRAAAARGSDPKHRTLPRGRG